MIGVQYILTAFDMIDFSWDGSHEQMQQTVMSCRKIKDLPKKIIFDRFCEICTCIYTVIGSRSDSRPINVQQIEITRDYYIFKLSPRCQA